MKIPWNYQGKMFLFIFLENNFSKNFIGIFSSVRNYNPTVKYTEICFGYTKFYALEKLISRRQRAMWTVIVAGAYFMTFNFSI